MDRADASPGVDATEEESSNEVSAEPTVEAGSESEASADEVEPEIEASVGDAGDAGDAAPALKACFDRCTSNAECPGNALNPRFCNTMSQHCVRCLNDVTCVAQQSGWMGISCTADSDCATDVFSFGDYCIDVEGTGRCAFDFSRANDFECTGTTDPFTAKKFASDDMVTVCADTSRSCDQQRGICAGACTAGSCTPARGGNICNSQTGRCECATNNDCGSPASVCNQTLGQCECASSNECPGADAAMGMVCE